MFRREAIPWFLGIVTASAVTGYVATQLGAVLAVGALLAVGASVAAVRSPQVRLVASIGGALLVFQAPGDGPKVGYLGLILVCLAVALVNLIRRDDGTLRAAAAMLFFGVGVVLLLAATFFVSSAGGISVMNWARDILGYFMLVALPIIGLEAARGLSARAPAVTVTMLGVVAAIGFATDWLNRRGATEGLGRFVLASATFSLLAFIYTAVRCCNDRAKVRWFVLTALIGGALLITGTRTNLLLLAAALVGMCGSLSKGRVPVRRVVVLIAAVGATTAVLLPLVGSSLFTDQDWLDTRVEAFATALDGGLTQDQSFAARSDSYALAAERWHAHYWFGGGPGYLYPNGQFSLDTPTLVLAKFGIVGTVMLLGYLLSIAWSVLRLKRLADPACAPVFVVGRSWAWAMVALTPFGPFIDDKGSSISIMLIVAMAAVAARENSTASVQERAQVAPVPTRVGVARRAA